MAPLHPIGGGGLCDPITRVFSKRSYKISSYSAQGVAALRTLTTLLLSTPFAARVLFGGTAVVQGGAASATAAMLHQPLQYGRASASVAALAHALDPSAAPGASFSSACNIASSGQPPSSSSVAGEGGAPRRYSGTTPTVPEQQQRLQPALELSAALREALVAHAAVSALESALPGSPEAAAAVYSLAAATALSPPGAAGPGTNAARQASLLALSASPRAIQVDPVDPVDPADPVDPVFACSPPFSLPRGLSRGPRLSRSRSRQLRLNHDSGDIPRHIFVWP